MKYLITCILRIVVARDHFNVSEPSVFSMLTRNMEKSEQHTHFIIYWWHFKPGLSLSLICLPRLDVLSVFLTYSRRQYDSPSLRYISFSFRNLNLKRFTQQFFAISFSFSTFAVYFCLPIFKPHYWNKSPNIFKSSSFATHIPFICRASHFFSFSSAF